MSMEKGFVLGSKYRILEEVGRGAFSNCYRAHLINEDGTDVEDSTELWVKLCHYSKYSFKNEFEISQEITIHDRLLKSIDFDVVQLTDEETWNTQTYEYITSEFMPNGDLFGYVNSDCFDEEWARLIFKQILRGLESLHNDGFAHMDIKLGNILLDSNFLPKLADFGFTIRVPKDALLPSSEFKNKGTKHYIPPEILEGSEFNGYSADIFALGVVFFALMIGDYPFDSATKKDKKYGNFYKKSAKIFWAKHSKAKKRISKGLISESFVDLITRMLLPNPDERLTIEEIKMHDWYQQSSMGASDLKDYFESLKALSKSRK